MEQMQFADKSETQQVSKYNSAIAKLIIVNNLWNRVHTASLAGNYRFWNLILDKIFTELCSDLQEGSDREKKVKEQFIEFAKKLSETGAMYTHSVVGFSNQDKEGAQRASKQYLILIDKEIWLKRIQNMLGKGTVWQDDEDTIE